MNPDPMIVDTVERMLEDHCTAAVVQEAQTGEWPQMLWRQLEDAGLPLTWVAEEHAGAGAGLIDGFAVAKVAGRYALPVPLVETLLAGWVLSQANVKAPAGPMTVAPSRAEDSIQAERGGTLSGEAHRVPFARNAEHLVVVTPKAIGLVETKCLDIVAREGVSGEPRDTVTFEQTPLGEWSAVDSNLARSVQLMGAVLRAQQMAGALEQILALSTQYAGERSQFGRPIAKFQAVQHNVAVLAGEMAAAGAAANTAARVVTRYGLEDDRSRLAVATAKIRAGEAAGAGSAIAHQVHGAMGFTREYRLHHFTRRLLSWRDDFGSENRWARELGRYVAEQGADALWPSLTSI